eukprot:493289-Prymnesium_polylepis.1
MKSHVRRRCWLGIAPLARWPLSLAAGPRLESQRTQLTGIDNLDVVKSFFESGLSQCSRAIAPRGSFCHVFAIGPSNPGRPPKKSGALPK